MTGSRRNRYLRGARLASCREVGCMNAAAGEAELAECGRMKTKNQWQCNSCISHSDWLRKSKLAEGDMCLSRTCPGAPTAGLRMSTLLVARAHVAMRDAAWQSYTRHLLKLHEKPEDAGLSALEIELGRIMESVDTLAEGAEVEGVTHESDRCPSEDDRAEGQDLGDTGAEPQGFECEVCHKRFSSRAGIRDRSITSSQICRGVWQTMCARHVSRRMTQGPLPYSIFVNAPPAGPG
eukprot:4115002-Amphidinium_carterae.1